jgi:hypothetical protein
LTLNFAKAFGFDAGQKVELQVATGRTNGDGAPVDSVYTVVEIGEHHALRIGVLSTGDRLSFTFTADPHLIRDLDQLAVGVEVEAARLAELAEAKT